MMAAFPTVLFTEIWADENMLDILVKRKLAQIDHNYKVVLTNYGVQFFINYSHLTRSELKNLIKDMDNVGDTNGN
jgi:hypothetical protein